MESTTPSNPSPAPSVGVPTLHHLESSQSLRILWALEELVAASPSFTYKLEKYSRIKGRAPKELQSVYYLGLSPILVVEPAPRGSSPDEERTVVAESRLILQYLADHYSDGLWEPQSKKDRVRNNYFQEFSNASLGPKVASVLQYDIVPAHVPFILRPLASPVFNGLASYIRKDLVRPFQLMEDALATTAEASSGERRLWFAGDKIGLADFCLSWPMDACEQRGYFDAEKYPKVAAWLSRVHERDAYVKAREKGGSYDLVSLDWK